MKRWAMTLFVFAGSLLIGSSVLAQPATGSFGFNGTVSGFPTGEVRITGGGAYDLDRGLVVEVGERSGSARWDRDLSGAGRVAQDHERDVRELAPVL